MKSKKFAMLLCCCAAMLSAKELYPAGDFEGKQIKPLHIMRGDFTTGKRQTAKTSDVFERVQNEKVFAGKQSLLIESRINGNHSINLHNLKITPGKKYEFSWRYFIAERKSDKFSVSGRVIFREKNKVVRLLFPVGNATPGQWHQVKLQFYPPVGADSFSTTIWVGRGQYRVYLDDVKVTEFEEGKTPVADSNTLMLKDSKELKIWKQTNYRRIDAFSIPENLKKASVVKLTAAANEMEPFQLAVFPKNPLKQLSVSISDFKGKNGVIAAKNHTAGILLYVHIKNPANPTLKGDMADPIADDAFTDAPAGKNTIFYVRIFAPKGTKAGVYKGSVTLKSQNKALAVIPVELTVRNFELPDVPNLRTFFYGAPGVTRRLYRDSRPYEEVRANFIKIYKNHRMAGNQCIHAVLPKYEIRNGRLIVTDWSEFDKQTREFYRIGQRSFTVPGLGMLGDNGRWFGGAKGPRVFGHSIDSALGRQLAGDYARQFHEHWQTLKLPGARYYAYIYDEPAAKAYKRLNAFTAAVLKEAPKFRFFVTHRMDPELKNITIHCIPFGPGHVNPELEKGKENFYYNWGQPMDHRNYIKSRLYAWQIVANGGQGGLMWQTTATRPGVNPWTDLEKVHRSGPVATTIFPARTKGGELVPTLRLAQVREAIDDADYLFILKNKVEKYFPGMGQKYMLSRIKDLIPELPFGFVNDSELLYAVRSRLGDEIENFEKAPVCLVTSMPACYASTEVSEIEIRVRGPQGAQVMVNGAKAGVISGKFLSKKIQLSKFGKNVIPVKVTFKGKTKSAELVFTLKRDPNLVKLESIVKELDKRKLDTAAFKAFIKKASAGIYTAAMRAECVKQVDSANRGLLKSRLALVKKSSNPLVNAVNAQAKWMFDNQLYERAAYYLDLAGEFAKTSLSSKSKLKITPVKLHGNFGYKISNGLIEFTLLEVGGRIISFKVKGVECFAAKALDKSYPLKVRAGKLYEQFTHMSMPNLGGYEDAGLEVLPESAVDWDISVKEISNKRIALEVSMLMRGKMFRISRIMSIVPGKPELKIDYTISNVFPSEFKSDDPTHYHFPWRGRLSPRIGDNSQGDAIEVPTLKKLKQTFFDVKQPIFYEERSVPLTESRLGSYNAQKKTGFTWKFDPAIRYAYLWFNTKGDHNGRNKIYTLEIFRSFYGNTPGVPGNTPFYIEPGKSVSFSMSFIGRTGK